MVLPVGLFFALVSSTVGVMGQGTG